MRDRPTYFSILHLILACLVVIGSLGGAELAQAQVRNGDLINEELERQIRQRTDRLEGNQQRRPEERTETILPNGEVPEFNRLSAIEELVKERSGKELRQFGYEEFGKPKPVTARQSGALQDNYVLGIGDEVIIDLRGQQSLNYRIRVDRDGRITLPNLLPISAAGRRFAEFRAELEQRVSEALLATQVFATVGSVRQISVLVTGEVRYPGAITLNALNTATDALLLSGGVLRSGSLRNIKIIRGDQVLRLDIYGLLSGLDVPLENYLADGDRIIVHPLGQTVAVTGPVNRPGIYELAPGQATMDLNRFIDLAGGFLRPSRHRVSALRLDKNGVEKFVGLGSGRGSAVYRGDIVFVEPTTNIALGRIALEGYVALPGIYDTANHPTLRSLLGQTQKYHTDSYMLFGAVSRRDPATNFRTLVPFSPLMVLQDRFDLELQDNDIIRVFSLEEVQALSAQLAQEKELTEKGRTANHGYQNPEDMDSEFSSSVRDRRLGHERNRSGDVVGLPVPNVGTASSAPTNSLYGQRGERTATQSEVLYRRTANGGFEPVTDGKPQEPQSQNALRLEDPKRQIKRSPLQFDLEDPALRSLIGNYTVEILGAVQVPGSYLITEGTSLDHLVAVAGGISVVADLTAIEITSTDVNFNEGTSRTTRANFTASPSELVQIGLKPKDVIRFREVYSDRDNGQVFLAGQVRYPGRFDILRGEKLSSVLARAGGLTDIAYPYGAVFTRVSAAAAEEEGYRRAAEELERQFAVLVAEKDVGQQGIMFVRQTIEQLKEAEGLGRVSVEADPVVLAGNPSKDIILEPGDQLIVPRRPNSVSVTGEVLSAGSYQFNSGRGSRHYINLAGGFGPVADKKRAFVLLPDGTARRISGSVTSFRNAQIVPGSTIIVPRDLTPFRFRQFALDLTQITSQLAVSAASIAVVSRDN